MFEPLGDNQIHAWEIRLRQGLQVEPEVPVAHEQLIGRYQGNPVSACRPDSSPRRGGSGCRT